MGRPFAVGERVLLVDAKARRYLVTLSEGGEFHSHAGVTPHALLIGEEEGITVRSSAGARYTAVRPTLADFAARARRNVESFLGPELPYRIEERSAYEGIHESDLDRVVLDLPEPCQVVKHAEVAMRAGGILVAYVPTVGQVAQLREELATSSFAMAQTVEVLQRTWHVEGQSVRPDHRMVGHTGFLTSARLLGS